jgi:hypothetical protein
MSDGFNFENVDLSPSVRARRRRGRDRLTRALVVALGLALAFSAGVQAGRASRPAAPATVVGAGSPVTGTSSPAAGPGAPEAGVAVTGRVNIVDRDVIYVVDSTGRMVKVVVTDGARLSATRPASRADLHVGDTVVVRGERAADGTVSAATVTDNGPG